MTIQRPDDLVLERRWAAGTEVVLNNIPLKVQGAIGYSLTNVYPRPERQGEPGPADHPYNATHTQRTWVDGQLRRDMEEAAEVAAYWDAHAWVQNRGMLGAPLLTVKIPLPAGSSGGMVVPHKRLGRGFIYTTGNIGGEIYEYRATDGLLRNPGGLNAKHFDGTVTNKGVVFRTAGDTANEVETWLYIPSTAGYVRISDDFSLNPVAAPGGVAWDTVGMALHENKLYRLTGAGAIFSLINHDDDWTYIATIPDGSDPRNIYQTNDDDGNRCIGVTTSSGLFLLDHDNGILWDTDLKYPEHAYQGYGAVVWRADDYISVGVGIHRRVGGQVIPEGLDNYQGLPSPLAGGFITDLAGSYNWAIAAIAGELQGESATDFPTAEAFGLTQGIPYPIVSKGTNADFLGTNRIGAIFVDNGLGWAKMYQWNRPPTRVEVASVFDDTQAHYHQEMFFGDYDGGAYHIQIPGNYYNPLISPTLPLERKWYLEESRLDWNAKDTPKLAKQINVKVDQLYHVLPNGDGPFFNTIQVICHWLDLQGLYHTSEDPDVLAGDGPYPFVAIDETGQSSGPIPYLEIAATDKSGNSRRAASVGWERYTQERVLVATGLPHESIWFTYRGVNDPSNVYTTGIIEWRSIIGRKWMRPNRVWTIIVDAETANKDLSETEVLDALDDVCLKVGGVPLVIGDEFHVVDVTRNDGSSEAGLSPRGTRTITCLEFTDITYEKPIPPAG